MAKCWADKKISYTDIDVLVNNEDTGEPIKGIPVKLYSSINGTKYLGS